LDFFEFKSEFMKIKTRNFYLIYTLGFLWALGVALPSYIQSSFLEEFVRLEYIGLYLALATFITLLVILAFPRFIKRFSNYRVLVALMFINIVTILFLITARSAGMVLIWFVIYYLSLSLMAINLDIALENISDDAHTGHIRTTFLTITNIGWGLAPIIMGQLAGDNRYWLVYLIGGLALVPALILLFTQKKMMVDHVRYKNRHFHELIKIVKKNKNISRIFTIAFLLRLFYSIMVLYIPVYLHNTLGIPWSTLGIMFTIMLLPFVILQLPAGNLADRYLGEKEIMVVGLIIMMVTVGSIFLLSRPI